MQQKKLNEFTIVFPFRVYSMLLLWYICNTYTNMHTVHNIHIYICLRTPWAQELVIILLLLEFYALWNDFCPLQRFDTSQMLSSMALMKKRNDDLKSVLFATPKNFIPKDRPRSSSYGLDWRRSLAEMDGDTETGVGKWENKLCALRHVPLLPAAFQQWKVVISTVLIAYKYVKKKNKKKTSSENDTVSWRSIVVMSDTFIVKYPIFILLWILTKKLFLLERCNVLALCFVQFLCCLCTFSKVLLTIEGNVGKNQVVT